MQAQQVGGQRLGLGTRHDFFAVGRVGQRQRVRRSGFTPSQFPLFKKKRVRRHHRAGRSGLRLVEMDQVPDRVGPARADVRQVGAEAQAA